MNPDPSKGISPARCRFPVKAVAAALALAGASAAALWVWRTPASHGETAATAAAAQEVRSVLTAFLSASTAEARAAHVVDGAAMLPVMQAYYAGRELETLCAEAFEAAGGTFTVNTPSLMALTLPRDRGRSAVTACFGKSADGKWLLDWDIWRQTHDAQFRDFLTRPSEGEQTLRVRLTNQGEEDGAINLEVADPFNGGSPMRFEVRRDDLLAMLRRDLPPGSTRNATVQLVWLNDGMTGTLQSSLRRHVCWGFSGLDGIAAAPVQNPRAGKYRFSGPPAETPAIFANGEKVDASVKAALSAASASRRQPAAAPVVPVAAPAATAARQ